MAETACPHTSPRMIAAGIFECAECEQTPPAEFVRDDLSRQKAALESAFADLTKALERMSAEASTGAKACGRKRPNPDEDRLRAAWLDVDRAFTGVDTATYDLQTARGADG